MAACSHDLRKTRILLLLLFIIFSLIGCAGALRDALTGSYQTYSGPLQPKDTVAFVTRINDHRYYDNSVSVERIGSKAARVNTEFAEFLPGKHVICVGFYAEHERSTECFNLEIHVKSGRVYQLYRVNYTHNYRWYPAIWDITDELAAPEQSGASNAFNKMLQKTGREPLKTKGAAMEGIQKLPGFGEKIKKSFRGKGGKQVSAEYAFYRYAPYVLAEADDGLTYHVQISEKDGAVVQVLGTRVSPGKVYAFQPLDSDLAYTYFGTMNIGWMPTSGVFAVHKETAPGKYILIKQAYTVTFNNLDYTALLELSSVDGLNKDARRAMVLALNAEVNELRNNSKVMKILRQRYSAVSEGMENGLKKLALENAKEAIRTAEQLVAGYPANSPEHQKAQSILAFSKQKLK